MESPNTGQIWLMQGAEKRARVQEMFAGLASHYDLLNSLISARLHYRWRKVAVDKLNLKPADTVLDVCCGTGAFSPAIRAKVGSAGRILGFDFCRPMLEFAFKNRASQDVYSLGDALSLPVRNEAVDGVTVGWGIRNVVDIDRAHREIYRVLKPGKRFVSVDMALPRNPLVRQISTMIFVSVVPALGALFGKSRAYLYLPKSTEKFMSREQLGASMEKAGFKNVGWQDLMLGNVCIHAGEK